MKVGEEEFSAVFGPIPFRIEGAGELFESIRAAFGGSVQTREHLSASISYHLVDSLPATGDETMILAGNGWSSATALCCKVTGFDVRLELVDQDATRYRVYCSPSPTSRRAAAGSLPKPLQRFLTSRYVTTSELLALDFVYHVFLWTMQLALLERDASLVHASSMYSEVLDETLLIAGWGGVGKTSLTSFGYLEHSGKWQFLADDLSIIDRQGSVWFNPMGIHFYPYNTEGFPKLWNKVADTMSILSRLHWEARRMARGDSAAVRRVDPGALWPVKRSKSQLTTVCVLERWSDANALVEKLDATALAAKALHVLMDELSDITIPLILGNATRQTSWPLLPSLPVYIRGVEEVYGDAFQGAHLLNIRVPDDWNPTELGAFIFEELGWAPS